MEIPQLSSVAGQATIDLFDVSGRLVRKLLDRPMPAGETEVIWNGHDAEVRPVGPGEYLLRLQAAGAARQIRLVRL